MDYDFSGLCSDQIEKLSKRLTTLKETFIKEYIVSLYVINNPDFLKDITVIKQEIDDAFTDTENQAIVLYTRNMDKIQSILTRNL